MEVNLSQGLDIDVQDVMTGRGCVIGQSGSGKSFLAGVVAEELCKAELPFCVIDTEGEYSSLKGMFNVIVVGGEHQDLGLDSDFSRVFGASIQSQLPVVLDLSDVVEREEIAYKALEALYRLEDKLRKPYLVMIEEADRLAPQVVHAKANIIEEISVRGRKRGIGLFITTQRPANISKNVLAQCSYGFIGKLTIENDINAIKILFEDKRKLAQITRLGTGEFIPFGLEAEDSFKVKPRQAKHTSATPYVDYSPINEKVSIVLSELKVVRPGPGLAQKRPSTGSASIEAIPVSFSPDSAKEYAERMESRKFVIFGNSTEKIDCIELRYMPLGLCSIRIPTNRNNEYLEYYCIIDAKYRLARLDNGVKPLTEDAIQKYAKSDYKAFLRKEGPRLETVQVQKGDLPEPLDIKQVKVCIRKYFHTSTLMEFRNIYLPAYSITLRKDNKVRVFGIDGMYGRKIELS